MQKYISRIVFFSLGTFLLSSCYKEFVFLPDHKNNVFNFTLSPDTKEEVLNARDSQFYINPTPNMYYGELQYGLDNAKVRGRSATKFQRKSYALNLADFIVFADYNKDYREFEKFKLIAMCHDYTYIENHMSHTFLQALNLWPLHTFYTEVMLNNSHQGLYLFIEDPEEYCFQNFNAEVVIRRHYKGGINKLEINNKITTEDSSTYAKKFNSVYELLANYSNEQLFVKLSEKINLQNYMRKIAFDFLVKNGDYNDEIYFYGKKQNDGSFIFEIIPWDYDDLFSSQPHEIGRDWAVGTKLGTRIYSKNDDVLKIIGDRLIFSIEDDIDYLIATDDYLYQKYLKEMQYVLSIITSDKIDEVLNHVHEELLPFYAIPEIIEQSKFDADSTSLKLLELNIINKSEFLKNRVLYAQDELDKQIIDQ